MSTRVEPDCRTWSRCPWRRAGRDLVGMLNIPAMRRSTKEASPWASVQPGWSPPPDVSFPIFKGPRIIALGALGLTAPFFILGAAALVNAIPGLPEEVASGAVALAIALQLPIALWICWPRRGTLSLHGNRLFLASGDQEIVGADIQTIRVGRAHGSSEYTRYVMLELTFPDGRTVAVGTSTQQNPSSYGRYRWRRPDWVLTEQELGALSQRLGLY